MKKLGCTSILLFSILVAHGQYLRDCTYKTKPVLDWGDFTEYVDVYSEEQKAYLCVTILTETKNVNVWTGVITVDAYAMFKKDSMWVLPSFENDTLLRYMQLQYDYANMIAKKSAKEINSKKINAANRFKLKGIIDTYLEELRETLKHLDAVTKFGTQLPEIEKWEGILKEQIILLE